MTRRARDGRDKPFCDWLRNHDLLDAAHAGLHATDVDMSMMKYRTTIDAVGTRQVKLMADVEVKTWGRWPDEDQHEHLYFRHQQLQSRCRRRSTKLRKWVGVWHFGVSMLSITGGERPDDCEGIQWGRFEPVTGAVLKRSITEDQLVSLLRFDLDHDTVAPFEIRRHHKTQEWVITRRTELGLRVDERLRKSS
jgi:hypothetical protein